MNDDGKRERQLKAANLEARMDGAGEFPAAREI